VIKTLVKLAIVALVANAAWQTVNAYWPHYKFREAVRSTAQYRGERSDAQLRARILELAATYDVPLADEDLTVRREQSRTIVEASYVRPVDLAPGYTYRWPFKLFVDATSIGAADADSPPK
jgi:hypothetical protein